MRKGSDHISEESFFLMREQITLCWGVGHSQPAGTCSVVCGAFAQIASCVKSPCAYPRHEKKKKGSEFQTAAARPCFFLLNPGATRDGQMQFTAAMWGNGDGRKGKEKKKGTRKGLASYVTAAKPTAKPFCFAVTGWSDWCVRAPWPGGSPQYIIIYFSLLLPFLFGVTEW